MQKAKKGVDELGRVLVGGRDRTLNRLRDEVSGRRNPNSPIRQHLGALPPEAFAAIIDVVTYSVDLMLFNVVAVVEESEQVTVTVEVDGEVCNVKDQDASEGLLYEVVGDEGWVRRYGKNPRSPLSP